MGLKGFQDNHYRVLFMSGCLGAVWGYLMHFETFSMFKTLVLGFPIFQNIIPLAIAYHGGKAIMFLGNRPSFKNFVAL